MYNMLLHGCPFFLVAQSFSPEVSFAKTAYYGCPQHCCSEQLFSYIQWRGFLRKGAAVFSGGGGDRGGGRMVHVLRMLV